MIEPCAGRWLFGDRFGIEAGLREVAGEHVVVGRAVVGVVMAERADQRELVHLPGRARQVLADLDAGHVGGDGLELAAKLGGRVGLQVPGVDGAQAAVQEQEDQRDIARASGPRWAAC